MTEPSLPNLLANLAQQLPDASVLPDGKAAAEPLSLWPPSCQQTVEQVLGLFEQVQHDCEQLTADLLSCYEHLNKSFATITAVGRCTTEPQALETLTQEIARAVSSDISYYLGPLPAGGSAWRKMENLNLYTTCAADADKDYLAKHRQEILSLVNLHRPCQAAMIDYPDRSNHDHNGRGNVLVLSLTAETPQKPKGTLIFIRSSEHEPFAAIEMNLADSLAKMGSAVLDGIIYASQLNSAYLQTISSLVRAIEAKDSYTCGHSTRVAEVARKLGEAVGLPAQELQWLEWAGLLHDIGKIGIDDQIIRKPGKLTDEEFAAIKSHPEKSYKVLEPIEALRPALAAARHHHERFDGTGYPDGLKGEDIPLSARILQIADIWDALTSTRSYRQALKKEKALSIMQSEAGTVIDPILFEKFQSIFHSGIMPMENLIPSL